MSTVTNIIVTLVDHPASTEDTEEQMGRDFSAIVQVGGTSQEGADDYGLTDELNTKILTGADFQRSALGGAPGTTPEGNLRERVRERLNEHLDRIVVTHSELASRKVTVRSRLPPSLKSSVPSRVSTRKRSQRISSGAEETQGTAGSSTASQNLARSFKRSKASRDEPINDSQ